MITAELLRRIMPGAGRRAELFAPHLEAGRRHWVGDDWHHVAMWLAQIAHESGSLQYVREIASGEAYEGRADLGNTQPGDGPRFRGRGLLQVTGRANYARCGQALGLPLLAQPELLEQPEYAAASAGWVWQSFGCAELMAAPQPLTAVTRRINGGLNGLESRRHFYVAAVAAMKSAAPDPQAAGAPEPATAPPPAPSAAPPAPAPFQPAPVGEDPYGGQTMPLPDAAAAALGAELLKLLPMFSSGSKTAERNVAVAQAVGGKLVELARETVGPAAVNEQQAVEQVLKNPQLQQQFVARAVASWPDLAPFLEHDSKERQLARAFAERMSGSGPLWRQIGYAVALFIVSMTVIGTFVGISVLLLTDPATGESLREKVYDNWQIFMAAAVFFWLGSSSGSQRKDANKIER